MKDIVNDAYESDDLNSHTSLAAGTAIVDLNWHLS